VAYGADPDAAGVRGVWGGLKPKIPATRQRHRPARPPRRSRPRIEAWHRRSDVCRPWCIVV